MRQFNKFKDTKGFITIWQRVLRFRYMITEQAKERCRILAFWERHGTEATKEAFRVSRRTLFRWQKKLRRPKGYRVLEVDTVVRFIDGVKRYIITATDTEKHTAFAACYTNHGSVSASDFLKKCIAVLPDCPTAIQTDNGSEFALHFDRACASLSLERFHTYPRSPKMNAHVERFNRTLDEEFLIYHRALLRDDVAEFNNKLIDWLLWYNGERPHHSLSLLSPFQYIFNSLSATECHMWWTNTVH